MDTENCGWIIGKIKNGSPTPLDEDEISEVCKEMNASRGSRTLSVVPSEEYIKDFSPIDYFNMEKVVKLYCEKHKCQIISNEAYRELCGRGIAG